MRLTATLLALLLAGPAAAQFAPSIQIKGRIGRSATLTLDQLRALPQVSVDVPLQAPGSTARYTGALLWPLLLAADPLDPPGRRTPLQHTVIAHSQDGSSLSLEMTEMDPAREGKPVLIATERDGAPLPAPALVLPGDARTARIVPDLADVEVR